MSIANRPTQSELLEACERFLAEELRDQLQPDMQFKVRVVCSLLRLINREQELAGPASERALERLQRILGSDADLETLNRELSQAIRAGEIPLNDPDLQAHLLQSTRDKLRVDNPNYAGVREH